LEKKLEAGPTDKPKLKSEFGGSEARAELVARVRMEDVCRELSWSV
jgi:hypothetical protein